eukprot:1586974-Amphidinium_carterae.1
MASYNGFYTIVLPYSNTRRLPLQYNCAVQSKSKDKGCCANSLKLWSRGNAGSGVGPQTRHAFDAWLPPGEHNCKTWRTALTPMVTSCTGLVSLRNGVFSTFIAGLSVWPACRKLFVLNDFDSQRKNVEITCLWRTKQA